jgi:hypothetical protein
MFTNAIDIRNYTPHVITLFNTDRTEHFNFYSEGVVRAVQTPYEVDKEICSTSGIFNVFLMKPTTFGVPTELPEKVEGRIYIVSAIAAQAIKTHCPDRNDFYIVAETIRDTEGRITGCASLTQV